MANILDQELGGTGAGGGISAALGLSPSEALTSQNASPSKGAPPKMVATPSTIVTGLQEALNTTQEKLVKDGTQEYADVYKFVIIDQEISDASIKPPGETNLKQVPMGPGPDAPAADQKDGRKQSVSNNAKTQKIMAGTSIVQFLDQVMRSSTYIFDQQTKYYDAKTRALIENGTPAQTMGWYRIGLEAVPRGDNFYDRKRNDYAYDITYSINIYAVADVKSDFFPSAKFRGTHKRYDYWFTGKNSQILDFTQDYNYLYYTVINGEKATSTSNYAEYIKSYYQPRSDESSQGQNNDQVLEPSANAADFLYSSGDQAKIKLRIIGDPAWIFQGETWNGIQGLNFNYGPFLSDGTINYEGQQVLFEVLFNTPTDYDFNSGIMDVNAKNTGRNQDPAGAGDAFNRFIYNATECVSTFSKGKFEQDLMGSLVIYPLPTQQSKSVAQDTRPVTTPTTTNRTATASKSPQAAMKKPAEFLGSTTDLEWGGADSGFVSDLSNTPTVVTQAPTQAPTSGTQTVGTENESSAETNRLLGTARGVAVGKPEVSLYLNNGDTVQVTNQQQINSYRASGLASPQAANAATTRLNLATQAANNPTTAQKSQIMSRET